MKEIENQAVEKNEVWNSKPKDLDLEDLPKEKLPKEVKPMPQSPGLNPFKEWTKDNQMRQPIFTGLKAEIPNPHLPSLPDQTASSVYSPNLPDFTKIGKRQLKLTNLNKIFFPREKYTKGDLINYYREIAPIILPHLKDRPQSLLRYPNGIEGESFFQKNVSNLKLDWMMRARIKHDKETIEYMLVQDEAELIYLINLGCIDLNPWSSRIGKLDNPNYLVIDLDPEDISFEKVVEVALTCRKVLEDLGIESYPKTSGASGIHIYIPMGAKYNYEQVKNFAHLLCIKINEQIPGITSLERKPALRQKKIYLDFLQNNHGQTLASVYSVRPRPEAPVSTPLKWQEVTKTLRPEQFTIKNTPSRLQKQGDLFKETLAKGIDIKKILKQLELK